MSDESIPSTTKYPALYSFLDRMVSIISNFNNWKTCSIKEESNIMNKKSWCPTRRLHCIQEWPEWIATKKKSVTLSIPIYTPPSYLQHECTSAIHSCMHARVLPFILLWPNSPLQVPFEPVKECRYKRRWKKNSHTGRYTGEGIGRQRYINTNASTPLGD